jgi:hypothetical protein
VDTVAYPIERVPPRFEIGCALAGGYPSVAVVLLKEAEMFRDRAATEELSLLLK